MLNTLNPCRLFIMGASGSGTTTLGRAIANRWAVPHADVDDYFWQPTSPPYREKRAPAERIAMMREVFLPRSAWVLSGSIMGWGEELTKKIDAVVLLTLDPEPRMSRLRGGRKSGCSNGQGPAGSTRRPMRSSCPGREDMTTQISRAETFVDTNSGWQRCPAPSFDWTAPGRWTTSFTQ
ncbi:hypothetical protein [Arthrobacter sp. ov407]|uniref:hypothetical protein n=1 Tax=Arthrobacter sp. ov407 TaxID=1761748 RepID=UPI002108F946|nr:hypothetical protein [Arthrobacter sp. ov407]